MVVPQKSGRSFGWLLPLFLIFFTLIPPINFIIPPPTVDKWIVLMACTGLAGMTIIFLKTHWFVKYLAFYGFINAFFSTCPMVSFNCYLSIVLCLYGFILLKYTDWDFTFNILKGLYFLNATMMVLQYFNQDVLFNFGRGWAVNIGVVGQPMQQASFMVVLTVLLMQRYKWIILGLIPIGLYCNSSWTIMCCAVGVFILMPKRYSIALFVVFFVMALITNKINANILTDSSRLHVWIKSLELSKEHWLTGWGHGMYRVVFPIKSGLNSLPWKQAHNDFVQYFFEGGALLLIPLILQIILVLKRLSRHKVAFAALIMIITDMLVHFPFRMMQSVPLIVIFLAYVHTYLLRHEVPSNQGILPWWVLDQVDPPSNYQL